jgi:4-amino-4-deoxy-L-arabinose transferase-like glycosyltransferase
MKQSKHFSLPFWLTVGAISIFLVGIHFWQLSRFPVFADEAIYIRWAQLILDDWQQYLFFAMNDGKTPLFIWMLSLFQGLHSNQLVAGRLVSVFAGVGQILVTIGLLRTFGAKKWTQLLGAFLVTLLPYLAMYHHFALMDGWLTLLLSATFWAQIVATQKFSTDKTWSISDVAKWAGIIGLLYGLALWTKLPALFYSPVVLLFPIYSMIIGVEKNRPKFPSLVKLFAFHCFAIGIGLGLFVSLRISPSFGQLFSRGQDFTFSISEVFFDGKWQESFRNIWRFFWLFTAYLSWPVIIAVIAGFFSKKARQNVGLLFCTGVIFMMPFVILGKVVHPRYLLPSAYFFTIAALLSLEAFSQKISVQKNIGKKFVLSIIVAFLLGQTITHSSLFLSYFLLNPNNTPFTAPDRQQYLEEWSSGHGIAETVAILRREIPSRKIAVATEGRFGTLPDGLLLYFHGQNVDNLYIEGIGQYPVKSIPDFFVQRAKDFDRSFLVVNSHRMELSLPSERKVAEFCRPNKAPCLQIWDITAEVQTAASASSVIQDAD